MQTEIISIGGMGCDACSARIEKALKNLKGVSSAAVELASEKATVTYDSSVLNLSLIKETITEEGYEVIEMSNI